MQTGTTLIYQGSMNNHDTDVTDRGGYPDEVEEDEDTKERGNATSPAPSQEERKLRKSASSRPKSTPPQLVPERANQDQPLAEVLVEGAPTYPPPSPLTPRASQGQKDSFQRVNGRHIPSSEAMAVLSADDLPPPLYSRRPPTAPVLDEEYRYCSKDELVKPYRTHHCRTCGTVSESPRFTLNEGAFSTMFTIPLIVCAVL